MDNKKWKCPDGCKIEYVSVETIEFWENAKGCCALDDFEGKNVDYYGGGGIGEITTLRCPACNQVIGVKKEGELKI